ncbi:MAG: TasA family protein [Candidatus Nealsonbacteria bacterium]|nr:TasA family protein [Candidatus Nealsonbacteria bacterium]
MKKIILSLAIIGAASAIAVGGTIAYFSDTETSTGNTFTAGSLDLRFQVGGAAGPWTDVNGAPLFDGVTFPLGDMKPGDTGEKTVRLWVDDNPSCGKVSIDVTEDSDNTCTTPEGKDEMMGNPDLPGTVAGCDETGELNDNVSFIVWLDQGVTPGFQGPQDLSECDNDYVGQFEPILTSGTITEDKEYGIGELPITEVNAQCYGIAYCFGTWNQDGTCNGALLDNKTQSDSFNADLTIDALQKRNQFDSGCPTGDWLQD